MTSEELQAIRERADAATAGPWEAGGNPTGWFTNSYVVRPEGEFPHGEWIADVGDRHDAERRANGVFIAHAREDIPALLAEVARLRTALLDITGYYLHDAITQASDAALIAVYEIARRAVTPLDTDA